jgi:hypothetical protein
MILLDRVAKEQRWLYLVHAESMPKRELPMAIKSIIRRPKDSE